MWAHVLENLSLFLHLFLFSFNSLKIIEFIITINLRRVQVPWEDLFGKHKQILIFLQLSLRFGIPF